MISCPVQVRIFFVASVALAGMMALLLSISADVFGFQIAILQPSRAGSVAFALAVAGFANVSLGGDSNSG